MVYFSMRMGLVALVMVGAAAMLRTAAAQQQVPECAQKLVPCASYLSSTKPPESCCGPIKEAVKNELPCLCSLFSSPQILKAFNINLTQALELPKNCGINSDQSLCSKSTSPSKAVPPSTTTASPSTNTVKPAGSAVRSLSWIGVSGFIGMLWLWWVVEVYE